MSDRHDPRRLTDEALADLIEAMPQPSAPPELAPRLNAAYARAARLSRLSAAAFAGFSTFFLLLATVLLSSSLADVLTLLSAWAVAVRALVQVGLDLALAGLSRPSGVVLLAGQAVMLAAGIGVLARLMGMTAPHAQDASVK